MGLFDRFKGRAPAEEAPQQALNLLAPVSGETVAMGDIPDPVFSAGLLGTGCGIKPANETAVSPVAGTVTVVMGHAVGVTTDEGIEVLVHVGLDTVKLEGKGFTNLVSPGERVSCGQPLIVFDRSVIREAGMSDVVVTVVANSDAIASVDMVSPAGQSVSAGDDLLSVTMK